jgi:uncharacterized protein (DUF488 family)
LAWRRKLTTMTLHTIGYEGSNIECCLLALRKHGIDTVLDVRELPLSRKPGFSKRALKERLGQNGIEYIHVPALGCPKAIRVQYRDDHDWSHYAKAFIEYLDTQAAALEALVAKAAKSTCALLCFEADPSRCHRSLVTSAVAQRHLVSVCHILSHNTENSRPVRAAGDGRGVRHVSIVNVDTRNGQTTYHLQLANSC